MPKLSNLKFLLVVIPILVVCLFSDSVLAADNVVQTTFFGNIEDDGSGCGVYTILNTVLDILSIGVGILGVIGISVVGIKYLTSAGNEEQARTSRRRIFEILIGLAVYAVLYAGINWLTPGGKLNTGSDCSTISDQELQQRRAAADAERKAKQQQTNKSSGGSSSGGSSANVKLSKKCMKKAAKSIRNDICGLNTTSEKIAKAAELIAWPYGTSEKKYWRNNSEYGYMGNICFSSWKKVKQKTGKPTEMFMKVYDDVRPTHFSLCGDRWGNHTSIGASCDVFAGTVVRATGYEKIGFGLNTQTPHLNSSKKWKKVNTPKRGDFCNISSHSAIYLGNNRMAEAGYLGGDGGYFGHIKKGKCGGMNIYRATK